jgi:5-methyltetrahydropteroyltriglutamate--homocysteine methyltransferase
MGNSLNSCRRLVPPFRAEHIGSLLRPASLLSAREAFQGKRTTLPELRAVEDECIRDAVKLQKSLGFYSVTDGEFRRSSWRSEIVNRVQGFQSAPAIGDIDMAPDGVSQPVHIGSAPYAEGKLLRHQPIVADDCEFLHHLTNHSVKATLPSPNYMHFLRGPLCVNKRVYPSLDSFFNDLISVYAAELLDLANKEVHYVQLDEVALTALCDVRIRNAIAQRGENPERLIDLYIDLINRVAASRPVGMTLTLHMCRGNYRGKWLAVGGYDYLAERVFTRVNVDAFLLEFDTPRAGTFECLKHIPPHKVVVLGLISTKSPLQADLGSLKQRVESATRYFPIENLCLSPACGFASHWQGNHLTLDDQKRKLSLVVEAANKIWGA